MQVTGHIRKLISDHTSPVRYFLPLDSERIELNPYIGQTLRLQFDDEIQCIACGRKTNKSFNQGYCYPCLQKLARCDGCIVRPELCHYHEGSCREPLWGEENCMQSHYVYLANSSGVKVGITRGSQIPTRWIDQGASQALAIYQVKHRYLSGLIEIELKKHVADKTNWRRMLKGTPEAADLLNERDKLIQLCSEPISALEQRFGPGSVLPCSDAEVNEIDYPVLRYPEKVTALNFDKTPLINGVLLGIKGQYLILDTGVLNIRKFSGYRITLDL